ncbi:MAG TPA: patatin-like phospholipase family protein [Blastocatellia bacterium]|nr:patatin-like phospholipase family protein [Blastocatellia bacterium]
MAVNGDINRKRRPRVGLALGGGVARGMAHIGVLRELEKNNIPVDLIAGTSVGSLIGAGYAGGLSADDLEKLARKIRWSDLGRVTVSRLGFFNSARMEDYIRSIFPVHRIEDMQIPLGVVATDIQEGKMVVFTEGDVALAVRASCAIPCYFTPVMVNGRMMVDGGLVGHLPAAVARGMGADIVIAVDVHSQGLPIPAPTNIFTIMYQSLSVMGRSSVTYLYQDADVVVNPQVGHIRPDDLSRADEMIAAGEKAAREVMHRIKQKLEPERKGFFGRLFARSENDPQRLKMVKG